MDSDDVIRESLVARVVQLQGEVASLRQDKDALIAQVRALTVGVNNLMCLADESTKAQYRGLLDWELPDG